MTPHEFRIGNLIQDQECEVFAIDSISDSMITAGALGIYPAGFEFNYGIPLSEEKLIKLGFVKIIKRLKSGEKELWRIRNGVKGLTIVNHPGGFFFDSISRLIKIEHVHQLQNLYFALTGQELELKPETE